ncbi:MAG: kelch repeat-containing protein, partial [Pseudomonadota bacterium]
MVRKLTLLVLLISSAFLFSSCTLRFALGTSNNSNGDPTGGGNNNNSSVSALTLTCDTPISVTIGSFTRTNEDMTVGEVSHTQTLLQDGTVLILGGLTDGVDLQDEATLYDPSDESFTAVGPMGILRRYPAAVLMPDGKVIVAGGYNQVPDNWSTATTERYNPVPRAFHAGPALSEARAGPTGVLLLDGTALFVGGLIGTQFAPWTCSDNADVYSTAAGMSTVGSLNQARVQHTETLLTTGKVL